MHDAWSAFHVRVVPGLPAGCVVDTIGQRSDARSPHMPGPVAWFCGCACCWEHIIPSAIMTLSHPYHTQRERSERLRQEAFEQG